MKKKITITIEEWIIEKIKIQAIKEKRAVGDIVGELLKKYLENIEK